MSERPILMNGAMVRAVLDGRKTQTRRAVKLPPAPNHLGDWKADTFGGADSRGREHPEQPCIWHTRTGESIACPFGAPTDRLWVRETWAQVPEQGDHALVYRADGQDDLFRWKPSIHMPRWASRLTLEITDVRVQRLQDISEADACAEGIEALTAPPDGNWGGPNRFTLREGYVNYNAPTAIEVFGGLWNRINGAGAWEANPWVWALSFRRVDADASTDKPSLAGGE